MKTMRKWLIFLIMTYIELRMAMAELSCVEKEWSLQYKPYSSIILLMRSFCIGLVGALGCMVALMGLALLT